MAQAEILKPFILSWEGGFANDPYDRGGATNKGVTIGTFRSVYGQGKSVQDLKRLTDEQWMHIYKTLFWNRWKADEIQNQSVANILVDWVWASGAYGVRNVQQLLGVKVDGIVGPKTLAAVNGYPAGQRALFDAIKVARVTFINKIAVGTQARYKKGWTRRLNGIRWGSLVFNNGKTVTF